MLILNERFVVPNLFLNFLIFNVCFTLFFSMNIKVVNLIERLFEV